MPPPSNALKGPSGSPRAKPKRSRRREIHSRDFRNPELAERYFRRAVEQKDVPAETLVYLAELYERLRRSAEAAQLIDRALQLNGACPLALLARARLERQAGHLAEAEKLLRSIPAKRRPATRGCGACMNWAPSSTARGGMTKP